MRSLPAFPFWTGACFRGSSLLCNNRIPPLLPPNLRHKLSMSAGCAAAAARSAFVRFSTLRASLPSILPPPSLVDDSPISVACDCLAKDVPSANSASSISASISVSRNAAPSQFMGMPICVSSLRVSAFLAKVAILRDSSIQPRSSIANLSPRAIPFGHASTHGASIDSVALPTLEDNLSRKQSHRRAVRASFSVSLLLAMRIRFSK
mmetsp:Transcript_83448/g.131835  ORF Transcript_83448/g.131835 Transcript_83448/m.131835 type:complete len:207 (+) Transcript_83448:884-1504(+)